MGEGGEVTILENGGSKGLPNELLPGCRILNNPSKGNLAIPTLPVKLPFKLEVPPQECLLQRHLHGYA